jgi:hypothetical protein
LANAGGDTVNAIKAASDFGINKGGQSLAGLLIFVSDTIGSYWWLIIGLGVIVVVSTLFYTEMKNLISRVAQVKELLGERQWIVTPRSTARK